MSAYSALLAAAGALPVIDFAIAVEDPGNPGFALKFVDQRDPTHWFEQTDPAKQVAMPVPHADTGGRASVQFTGTQTYVSNKPSSYWSKLHNGTPLYTAAVCSPGTVTVNQFALILATKTYAATTRGYHLDVFVEAGPVNKLYFNTTNGTALVAGSQSAAIATIDNPSPASGHRIVSTYLDAANWTVRAKGAQVGTGAYAAAVDGGVPTADLSLNVGASNARCRMSMLFWSSVDRPAAFVRYWSSYGLTP